MAGGLSAVVVGAGFAGEGHTLALRRAGVEVRAICARDQSAVAEVAARLGVPLASVDWRQAIRALRPSIVAIATPASLRTEIVVEALAVGAHLLCDKPLALTGAEAGHLHDLAVAAGVRHAYATTFRYDPSVAWLAELVREGRIGRLSAVEASARFGAQPNLPPWSWWFDPDQGGGLLHNGITHTLGILERVCGGPAVRAVGDVRYAPVTAAVLSEAVHDFRAFRARRLTEEETNTLRRRTGWIESAYRALLTFATPTGEVRGTVIHESDAAVDWPTSGLRLFGSEGTLLATGGLGAYTVGLVRAGASAPEPLPVPERLGVALPPGELEQARWDLLVRDLVADIHSLAHAPYPTFREGWRYQVAIDALREAAGWVALP